MANVYYSKDFDKVAELFRLALGDAGNLDGRCVVKVHFGEEGNTRFVSPESIKPVIDILNENKADYFLTDTNTLYRGSRLKAKDHMKIALKHGFGKLGKIVIADGENGGDEHDVKIGQKHFESVKIASRIAEADSMIVISHFKGHVLFGFGGALKNLGMGCGSRAGKLAMHSKISPVIDAAECIGCESCVENCASGAIDMENEKARINDNCVGCAQCISICPKGAVSIPWGGATSNEAQERCAEYALGAAAGKKTICMTFIQGITEHCDCMADSKIIGKDVGIISSVDPVACDKAAYDLVLKAHGKDIFKEAVGKDGTRILDYSETIGVGKKKYKLIEV